MSQANSKKRRKQINHTHGMDHSTLFVSAKLGGILQSSGFLDLQSLISLGQTCRANAFDELSLILLIENEITRDHGLSTMKEAIGFWRMVLREKPSLREWLEREDSGAASIRVTQGMLSAAIPYEAMFVKMLRNLGTETEQLQLVSKANGWTRMSILHRVASSGSVECLKAIIAIHPESERLQVAKRQNINGQDALHLAAQSGNAASIKLILDLYPEAERLPAVRSRDGSRETVLHHVANAGNLESLKLVLSLYPESEYKQAVSMQGHDGMTVLHCAASSGDVESFNFLISLYPESERLQALSLTECQGMTVLHFAARFGKADIIKLTLLFIPNQNVCMPCGCKIG